MEATAGGTGRHLDLVAQYLPSLGIGLTLAVSPLRNPLLPEQLARHPDIKIELLPMKRRISPLGDLLAYRKIVRLLQDNQPDLIHTHSSKAGFLGRLAASRLGIPVVHTPHVLAMEWSNSRIYKKLEQLAARWTTKMIVLNLEQKLLAQEVLGIPAADLVYIPNGVDPEEFHPASLEVRAMARKSLQVGPKRLLIGMAARLEPQKGVGNLLRVAKLVLKEFPNAIFLLAGSGSLEEKLKKRCRALEIADSVRFLGECEHMPSFYHALDLFVLASLWEGMPYTILEAQASALAVVASATPGALALIEPGKTGMLAPIDDVPYLASAICTYLGNELVRERIGKKAREFVLVEHTAGKWAQSLAGLYHEIIAGKSGGE